MEQKIHEPLLSVEDLVLTYSSEGSIIEAVNGVSFTIERGKTLALVGETGAGKTSTAKAIMQILPDVSVRIKGGEILFEGRDLLKTGGREMRAIRGKKISMIFQDPMTALNPIMKIGDQISEVIKLHNPINEKEARRRAKEMLKMVGISEDRYDEYPHQFSGGMKQRVVIAIALACGPELLIADEPTTALDVTIQAQVLEMIDALKTESQTSMLLITHDLGVVAKVCDDIAVIYAGQIVESGTKEMIFKRPSHPYTIGLFAAVPSLEGETGRLTPIAGMPPDPTNLPVGCLFSPRCPYRTDRCEQSRPEFEELEEGHLCRCFYAGRLGE